MLGTEQTEDAITLHELLVANGEGTEYYQQASWYLALAYLRNHEEDKVIDLSIRKESINSIKLLTNFHK